MVRYLGELPMVVHINIKCSSKKDLLILKILYGQES